MPPPDRLTPLETLVMGVLWDGSPVTVREVRNHLEDQKPMAYNTVLTVLRILRDKGFVSSERVGRSDLYRPAVTRERMAERSLRETLQAFFRGSSAALVSNLLRTQGLSSEELGRIREEVDRRLAEEGGKSS